LDTGLKVVILLTFTDVTLSYAVFIMSQQQYFPLNKERKDL
jgi:hypothetical protein